ncbi:hypothetical protein [Virgibacillus chiguensis]|uniref:Secreted protein n=1 Tax=Virgibacillus chiguensis TaxID=411959 RepID=A0A1M5QLD4_9BACI|nr:hypothetical protein [Virgibacillus chiguensis]SHH14907.1 hypothetical protein SAMN05421807_104189 [Virgibacillus chiguensis]
MKLKKKIVSVATIAILAVGSIGASSATASDDLTPEVVDYAGEKQEVVEPQAVPAVVGTAFLSGAAGAAGAKVGDWVADKIIGIFSVEEDPVSSNADLDVMFD